MALENKMFDDPTPTPKWYNLQERVILPLLVYTLVCVHAKFTECEFRDFLKNTYEKEAREKCYESNLAEFEYETDVGNKIKEDRVINVTLEISAWEKALWNKYFKDLDAKDFTDPTLKRHVRTLTILGNAALCTNKLTKLTETINQMIEIYSTAKICPYTRQDCELSKHGMSLEPCIEDVMKKSTNYDELLYVWKKWRDATGAKIKDMYQTYVTLANEAAVANKFKDRGEYWRHEYDDPNFVQTMDDLWTQVEPLYTELHKYVGRKLKERYGCKLNISDGLIPAHVFGNMWAQSWNKIADFLRPFPDVNKVNIDQALLDEGYTVLKIFQRADKFYQSLGLLPMGMAYNESAGTMITKPTDGREVLCHASAWDFCDGHTYRLKMCTQVNFENFITVHHELGHIQYYMQYKDLPYNFREGANPGFHEAIGDTIALSVTMPTHLLKLNLLKNYVQCDKESINALMAIALDKIAFLPFGLLIDKWRWDVFTGAVPKNKWNSHWWEYRKKYQKIKPPVDRSDDNDFDPGAKFHIPGDSQYISYFLAHVLQFQFFKSLCITAKQYNPEDKKVPLHLCDFYESTAAGDKLRSGLQLGSSKHWSETLEILTGSKTVCAGPLLEYFEPLYKHLKSENEKHDNLSKNKPK